MAGEFPLQVPSEWRQVSLEAISEFITKGTTPTTLGFGWATTGILFLRSECVSENGFTLSGSQFISPEAHAALERSTVQSGDLLITITGNVGRVCLLPDTVPEANINQHIARVRINPDAQADRLFVCHQLSHPRYRQHFERIITGLAYPQVSLKQVREAIVALPPLPEQHKIAAILSSVDDAIEKTQAVIDQLEVVKKGLLGELLLRGMPGRHDKFRETELGPLPTEWSILTYGELAAPIEAAIQSGPFGSALKHSEFTESGHLVIGIDNVLDGRFSIGSNHRITKDKFRELSRFQARPLDLLITVMATVGRCCVVPADIEPAIITKHVYRLSVNRTKANPYFLMYCLYGIPQLAQEVRGSAQGLSRPGLNKALLLPLKFPIPPLEEQEEIVQFIQTMEGRLQTEQRALEAMVSLKAGLLDALLSGKVRVATNQEAA